MMFSSMELFIKIAKNQKQYYNFVLNTESHDYQKTTAKYIGSSKLTIIN